MINTFELKNAKIKYWIDELPTIIINNYLSVEDHALSLSNKSFSNAKIALEISLNKNAGYYGLLGVEYIPIHNSKTITINFNYTMNNMQKYYDTIEKYDDRVYLGLSNEYVDYTKQKTKKYLNNSDKLQSGLLNFCVAANSEVGSSPKLFATIAEMLIELIIITNNNQHTVDTEKIVKEIFYSSSLFN